MHSFEKPTSFRRFVSMLLSIALVASFAPAFAPVSAVAASPGDVIALADSTLSTSTITPAGTLGTNGWYKSNVDATITAIPSGETTITYGVTGATVIAPASFADSDTVRLATLTQEGTSTVNFYSTETLDAPGDHEATHSVDIKIDKSSPVTTATASPSFVTSTTPVSVTVSTTDPISGIDTVWYKVGASGSVLSTTLASFVATTTSVVGDTPVAFWARDKAGNDVATKTVDVIIDKTAPVTTSNRQASYVNTATITLTPTDAGGAGLKRTLYQLDGGTVQTGTTVVTTATVPALHTLKFWSEDNAGNVETSTPPSNNVTFTVTADTAAPVTTLVTKPGLNLADWQSTVVTFSLEATDVPAGINTGVDKTFYRLDSGVTVTYPSPGTIVTISKEGTTLLEYWSVDKGGTKEATQTATIKIDTVKPVSSNTAQALYDEESEFSVSATDTTSGIGSIKWSLDHGPFLASGDVIPGSANVTVPVPEVYAAGSHTLDYIVTDVAGNSEATQTVTFHVTRRPFFDMTSKVVFMNNKVNPATVTITTYLRDGVTPLGGRDVVLEYSSNSKFTGKHTIHARTTSTGWVRVSFRTTSRVYVRFRFEGDTDYEAVLSHLQAYVPKVALSTPSAKSPQRAGHAFTVTGKIYPLHKAGTRIKIERYLVVRGHRVSRGYVWATVYARNRYAYSARLVLGRGTWQLRAVAPYDVLHNTTASGFKTIVVR